MTLSVNIISWKSGFHFFEPILILPLLSKNFTPSNVLACQALYKLTYKTQERVFKYFFPEIVAPFLIRSSSIIPRTPNKFKLLNSYLATGVSFLILNLIKKPALAKVLINYRLYMMGLPLVHFAILTIILAISIVTLSPLLALLRTLRSTYRTIRSYLYSKQKSCPIITKENFEKAQEIKTLLKKLHLINPTLDEQSLVTETNSYLIDKVLIGFPSLPVLEKGNPLHIWDVIETIDPLIASVRNSEEDFKCPDGCDKKLELEEGVNTTVQDEIIKLLKQELERSQPLDLHI